MHMHNHQPKQGNDYPLKDFLPLIIIFLIILIITFSIAGLHLHNWMRIFMGSFFLVFGGFKVIKLHDFAEAYSMYDLVAQQNRMYAYAYPFIEITLGILYFLNWIPVTVHAFTLIFMLIGAAGVYNELRKGKTIVCACLGTVFKIPMTYVTLAEDLLMAIMALFMLIFY